MYAKGRLERVGMDENSDGHVDRWDRDEQMKYESEAAERKARDQMAVDSGDAGAPSSGGSSGSAGTADAGAAKGVKASAPPAKK